MPVKLIMTWDIIPEHEQEYFEFVVREFIPGVQRLGLDLQDAWATVYGEQPQILVGAVFPSSLNPDVILTSPEWTGLHNKLMDYIENYTQKLVNPQGGFQF